MGRARDRGLAGQVTFVPPQPIRRALAQGRIMVAPSRAESFPYAMLEAAAACQPLVATRVGGVPELFGPHAHALVRPDDPAGLADAVARKLAEPQPERAAAARALAEWVEGRFTIGRMVEGAQAAYDAALAARSVPAAAPQTSGRALRRA